MANCCGKMSIRSVSSVEKIGFIGLGNMGSRMSVNLVKNGYKVSVNDLNSAACKLAELQGAEVVSDCKKLAGTVDCLITMLPNCDNVLSLYNEKGVLGEIRPGTLVIDCSTIDPSTAVYLSPIFKGIGANYVDAPVSGGVVAAERGLLTFMVGGEPDDAEKARPILMKMGQNVIHCGPSGSGLIAKNCNNLLLGISMIGVSEAMNLGVKMGLSPDILAQVINISSGRCWSSDTYNPVPGVMPGVPSSHDYKPGFTVKMITKDLNIAKKVAQRAGIPFEMGEKTLSLYEYLSSTDLAERDFSVVYKYLTEKSE